MFYSYLGSEQPKTCPIGIFHLPTYFIAPVIKLQFLVFISQLFYCRKSHVAMKKMRKKRVLEKMDKCPRY
jgi:hypothetical protein